MKWLLIGFFAFPSISLWARSLVYQYPFPSVKEMSQWDGDWWEEPGRPLVPVVWAKLLIPYGEKFHSLTFKVNSTASQKNRGPLRIAAIPKPLCQASSRQLPVETPKEPLAPGELFPPTVIGKPLPLIKNGYEILYVPLFPFIVDTENTLSVSGVQLTLTVEPSSKTAVTYRGSEEDQKLVLDLIDNPEVISSYPSRRPGTIAQYLVIGPKAYLESDATSFFLANKVSRGITSETVATEDISAQTPGADLAAKIRATILNRYQNSGTQFVLLVGNGFSITPTRILTVSNENIPSDLYFGCLDGSGTSGASIDLACEVAVGRAPVSTLEEWQTFVMKSLKMHFVNPSDPEVRNVLNFGEKMDSSTLAGPMVEQLLTGGKAGQITTVGYPSQITSQKLYETFSKTFSAQEVIQSLNSGDFYTVNHLGHASETYCMRFQDTDIPKLTNPFPFFAITQGCHPGDLRGKNWASKLLLSNTGGAGAIIANSSFGWYQPNSSDGPSNRHHLVFYDTVFKEKITYLGKANQRAKERLLPQAASNTTLRKVLLETNLLGDPEIALKF